jgi:hypothetical protein
MERKWRSTYSSLISLRNSRIHSFLESLHTPSWCVRCVFWNHILRNTAIVLMHILLTVAFAYTSTHFDCLLFFYNYSELSRNDKNTYETRACLVFHAIRTIRFHLVIILVITFLRYSERKNGDVLAPPSPRAIELCDLTYSAPSFIFFLFAYSLVFLVFNFFHLPSFSVVLCHFRLEFFTERLIWVLRRTGWLKQ